MHEKVLALLFGYSARRSLLSTDSTNRKTIRLCINKTEEKLEFNWILSSSFFSLSLILSLTFHSSVPMIMMRHLLLSLLLLSLSLELDDKNMSRCFITSFITLLLKLCCWRFACIAQPDGKYLLILCTSWRTKPKIGILYRKFSMCSVLLNFLILSIVLISF